MGSDDDIQPLVDSEASLGAKEGEMENSAINVADPSSAGVNDDSDEESAGVEIHLTGCGASAFCDPSNFNLLMAVHFMCLLML